MLDYSAIAALHAIIETQGFESAARKLFITQSAVSQRIKSLENYYGEPLLVRAMPYVPTQTGQRLLTHYRQVKLLEESLQTDLSGDLKSQQISVALSRDSLETWFPKVIDQLADIQPLTLEIIADDQEVTIDYLQKGLVSSCISTSNKEISGCSVQFLGYFDYILVATPRFKKQYFHNKQSVQKNLMQAPTVIFDNKDDLINKYLMKFFNVDLNNTQLYVVPSVAGFRQVALKSYAYALIPRVDVIHELKQKKLVNLFEDKVWQMPLYYHSWNIPNPTYKAFNDLVLRIASKILRQLEILKENFG